MKINPDFIGIGATRSGTSWLHYILSKHPDIWMSPIKEIHYFDCQMNGEISFFCDFARCKERIKTYLDGSWDVNSDGFLQNLRWDYKYFFGKRSIEWYAGLFKNTDGRISGEITPSYAILDTKAIEIISANNDLRVIYLLRNPIQRGWSSIVNGLAKKKQTSIKNVPEQVIFSKIDSDGFLARSDYANNIRRWVSVIGPSRIFIGYFDDIISRPRFLIDNICVFLGARKPDMISEKDFKETKNASKTFSTEMPNSVARYLAIKLYPMIVESYNLLGGHTKKWLQEAEYYINK